MDWEVGALDPSQALEPSACWRGLASCTGSCFSPEGAPPCTPAQLRCSPLAIVAAVHGRPYARTHLSL